MRLINFFKKLFEKKRKVNITNATESLAIEFIKNTVKAINGQVKIEVERLGFSIKDIERGRLKLVRTIVFAESDSRFAAENFSIQRKGSQPRTIMVVKWSPSGFEIERYSDQVANAIKSNPLFGVKKDAKKEDVEIKTKRDVEIDALAAKKLSDHNNNLKVN